ncbi:MAG: tetratricopeptide repeat protein [Bernardetiaceae bacterium]|jgi:tetratricopeptide (TPR) repeat protein|nr:tetratricopeptide repeat protein [Bernardetiaceae bacterium]
MRTILTKTSAVVLLALAVVSTGQAQSWKPLYDNGMSAMKRQNYKDAAQNLEKAVPLAEKEFKNSHPNYLNTLLKLGEAYIALGDQTKGRAPYLTVATIKREQKNDRDKEYADVLTIIAKSYAATKDYTKADQYFLQAIKARQMNQGERSTDYLLTYLEYARMYRTVGQLGKAEQLYNDVYKIAKDFWGDKEAHHRALLAELGELYARMKQPEKAVEFYQAHLKAMTTFKQKPADFYQVYQQLAQVNQALKKGPEAVKNYQDYVAQLKAVKGDKAPEFLPELDKVIAETAKMGEGSALLGFAQLKAETLKIQKGITSPDYAVALVDVSQAQRLIKDFPAAQKTLQSSLGILAGLTKTKEQEQLYVETLEKEASLLVRLGQAAQGEEAYKKTIGYAKSKLGDTHPAYVRSLDSLGFFYLGAQKLTLADSLLKTSLEIRKKAPGEKHPDFAWSQTNYAKVMALKGKPVDAENLLRAAQRNLASYYGVGSAEYARSVFNLAQLQRSVKNLPEAMKNYRSALETQKRVLGDLHPETQATLQSIATLTEEMNKK